MEEAKTDNPEGRVPVPPVIATAESYGPQPPRTFLAPAETKGENQNETGKRTDGVDGQAA